MLIGVPQPAAALLTVIQFYAMDFTLIRRYDKQRQSSGSGRSWDFTFFIFWMVAILILQPIFLPQISYQTNSIWGLAVQVLGVILILIASTLHYWSRMHLHHHYAERVEVQPDHQVIDTGLYKLMRHPIITSFFGISTGQVLIKPALITLATLLYTVWNFTGAAKQDEDLLSQKLPAYSDYLKSIPRFFPR